MDKHRAFSHDLWKFSPELGSFYLFRKVMLMEKRRILNKIGAGKGGVPILPVYFSFAPITSMFLKPGKQSQLAESFTKDRHEGMVAAKLSGKNLG